MKIALIFPNYFRKNFFFVPGAFHLPLGLSMIAAVLRNAQHEVQVIDATAERLNIRMIEKRIYKFQPDVIGMTTNVAFARKSMMTAKWLKSKFKKVPIILGGPHATVEYETLLHEGCCDVVVVGEGERTILDLIDAIEKKKNYREVKGIAFFDASSNKIKLTDPQQSIENLDELPYPAWDLFPSPRKYFFATRGSRFFPVMTSRGCPYGCINCTKNIHGYKLRYRSVQNIIGEIKYLHDKFGMNEIFIVDDNFNYNVARAEEICDEIGKLDFKFLIKFTNGLRADKITPRLAWKLKQAGTYEIALGIESGNQEIVDKIGKKLDLHAVTRAISILKKLQIRVDGFFMTGLPYETVHTFVETKKFVLNSGLDFVNFFKVVPFKGTKLYDIILENGKIIDLNPVETNFFSFQAPMFELKNLPAELVELALFDLYRSFFFRRQTIAFLITHFKPNFWRWYVNFGIQMIMNVFLSRKQDYGHLKETVLKKLSDKNKAKYIDEK